MLKNENKLFLSEDLNKKIFNLCNYNGAKYKIIVGKIADIDKTNISFIEPHRVFISYKAVLLELLCFNYDNIFLYSLSNKINISEVKKIFRRIDEQLK